MMEDISAFVVVVVAVGIFALTAIQSLGTYTEGVRAAADFEEAFGIAREYQNHAAFLRHGAATTGELDAARIEKVRALASRDPAQAVLVLEMREHTRIRILDISCRPEPCVTLDLDRQTGSNAGNIMVFNMPVTLRSSPANIRGGIMEVSVWYR